MAAWWLPLLPVTAHHSNTFLSIPPLLVLRYVCTSPSLLLHTNAPPSLVLQALVIQTKQLGDMHVSTLCSQLVKAQVMLMQGDKGQCGGLLQRQLQFCERSLGPHHPLAAKMLAVVSAACGGRGEGEGLTQRRELISRLWRDRGEIMELRHCPCVCVGGAEAWV